MLPILETSYHDYEELSNRPKRQKPKITYIKISGCPFLDALFSVPKCGSVSITISKGSIKNKMISKKKLEQRKKFKEYLSIADKRVLDIKASGIELIADDEVFVLVNGTNNYWISNHGRMTNNLHGKFYMHKTGYAHFTLSGIEKKIETFTDKLAAEHFLENPNGYKKIWHIDRYMGKQ